MKIKIFCVTVLVMLPLFFLNRARAQEDALLWEISGKKLAAPSYLFGTIHAICESDMQIPDILVQKLHLADQLVLELDMDDPAMMAQYQKGMVMEDNKTIKDLLSAREYNILKDFVEDSLNISMATVNNLKPFFIGIMYFKKFLDCTPRAYDLKLVELAMIQQKEIKGLESLAAQFEIFEKIPLEEQAENLMKQTIHYEDAKKQYLTIVDLYKRGRINALYHLVRESALNKYESTLLTERNKKWIPVIEEMAAERRSFFAVGAAHLAGKNGIIHLLRRKGYRVTPIPHRKADVHY